MSRSGADLALLLLGGFRALVDAATEELARGGHHDVRPVHDFAMRAIAAGADSASELARRLSIAKQSAAKTIAVLQLALQPKSWLPYLPGLALLALPIVADQNTLVVAELALLAALLLEPARLMRCRVTPAALP